jgi:hypothetical protein
MPANEDTKYTALAASPKGDALGAKAERAARYKALGAIVLWFLSTVVLISMNKVLMGEAGASTRHSFPRPLKTRCLCPLLPHISSSTREGVPEGA